MKQIIIAGLLLILSSAVSASTFGILGGMGVIIPGTGTNMVVVPFDGRELFFSLEDCEVARKKIIRAPVSATVSSHETGLFHQGITWPNIPDVKKFDMSACIPTTIQN